MTSETFQCDLSILFHPSGCAADPELGVLLPLPSDDGHQVAHDLRAPAGADIADGPEYISETLRIWAEKQGIAIQDIQPGQPQQNAYVERYNRTVRHEWLDQYIIESIEEAQDQATQWLWTYNHDRPNMGIGGIIPAMKLKMAA